MGAECRGIHKAGDALRGLLLALFIEKQNGGQAEHLEVLQQRRVPRAIFGDINLQQNGLLQGLLNLR